MLFIVSAHSAKVNGEAARLLGQILAVPSAGITLYSL